MRSLRFLIFILVFTLFFICCKDNNFDNNAFVKREQKVVNSSNVLLSKEQRNQNSSSDYLPTSTTNQIIDHQFYTLSYSEKYEQAEWVAYRLHINKKRNHFKRPFFIEDPKVATGSADWKNYKNSGYDKGHLCPAGDMSFDKNAYYDTFFTSNISPQLHEFNDGVWNRLEEKVRYWAEKYDGLYVVTGGVLSNSLSTIGKEKVAIPNYFYKIILNSSNGNYKIIAFLIPNKKSDKSLYSFVVSVDSIEKMTGIDFFPKLEDSIENKLEKTNDYKEWSFN
ncbi:DNA/RNA non-specific endonuclease [Flavobacterium sp. N3904]|uniref:DNA/RNA non-specific endonuclease n=1 Tax=Flavobacterium sp. N3904 TaxID=2986835 RepID=UPI00222486F1|nr:DNA/RNA non-specific endonuclease [Flavobacterium sp. N3904]